ncbi:PAS domain S-box protein [uncultured Draconibacterium sp.]|uniref:hybrid sensor histidine kinase/response regulator n=1 Tax=uncultured Draconibacterium sp. TaxID=1573823 RepID=UPI003217A52B
MTKRKNLKSSDHSKEALENQLNDSFPTQQNLFEEVFKNNPIAIAILNSDGTVSMVNQAFCNFSGYSEEEITGKNWMNKLPPHEAERLFSNNQKRNKGDKDVPDKYEIPFYTKNGEYRYALISLSMLQSSDKTIASFIDITEQNREKKKRFQNEALLTILMETLPNLIWLKDVNGVYLWCNHMFERFFGAKKENIIGKTDYDYFSKEMAEFFRMNDQTAIDNGGPSKNEEWITFADDGHKALLETTKTPMFDTNGNFVGVLGLAHDITERKQLENQLEESIFFFKESQRVAAIGSYKADFISQTWESSEVLDDIFGIDSNYDRSVSPGWLGLIHPDDSAYMSDYLSNDVIKDQKPFDTEYRIIRNSDNEVRWVHGLGQVILDKDGNVTSLIGTIQDITTRKLAEQVIIENQSKLDIALKIAHLGPWEYDVKSRRFILNDTFYAIFKTNTEKEGGNTVSPYEFATKFVHPDDFNIVADEIEKALETNDPKYIRQFEHKIVDAEGEVGYLTVRFSILKDKHGKTIKLYGINQDITATKKAEAELRASEIQLRELNAMKDKFLSIIAHDLKSPFNSIMGLSDILVDHVKEGDYNEVETFAERILQSSEKAMDLLNNLVQWSQSETGRIIFNPKTINISQLINETVLLFSETARQKNIKISTFFTEKIVVSADYSMISTVLRNLLSNALKFTSNGGEISISAKKTDNELKVEITDNGIGIPENAVHKLFRFDESYTTTGTNQEQGTGMGLILCKEFIDKHKGSLGAKSKVGEGSTFYFTIPDSIPVYENQITEQSTLLDSNETDETTSITGLKLLIVEDDVTSSKLLSLQLQKYCDEILETNRGTSAIEICKQNTDINLILMDIQMPDINGFETTKRIREFNNDVIIIAQTAFVTYDSKRMALASGCTDFIQKPIDKTLLLGLMQKYLRKK